MGYQILRSLREPRNRRYIKSVMATLLPLALCLLICLLSPASAKPSPKYLLIETNESKNNDGSIGVVNKIRQAASPEENAKNDYIGDEINVTKNANGKEGDLEVIVHPCPKPKIGGIGDGSWTVHINDC